MRENGSQGEEGEYLLAPGRPIATMQPGLRAQSDLFLYLQLGTQDALRDVGILSHCDAHEVKLQNLHAPPSSKVDFLIAALRGYT